MTINEIAQQLMHDAQLGIGAESAMIDIKEYKIAGHEREIADIVAQYGFKCCKIENAPYPFSLMPLTGKLLIYK